MKLLFNSKIKKAILIVLSVLLLSSLSLLFKNGLTEKEINVYAEGLKSDYAYNSTFVIPDLVDANSGMTIDAEKILRYPNGKTYDKEVYTLDTVGVYTIEYKYSVLGKKKSVIKKFVVYNENYSFNDNVSFAEYESNPANLMLPQYGAGLKVSLYSKGFITFNQPIDLNTLGGKSPISFYVVPKKTGKRDFSRLIVKLTDAEDPTNCFTVYCNAAGNNPYTSIQAGAGSQPMTGRLQWGGEYAKNELQVGGSGGQLADMSFTGQNNWNLWQFNLQLNLSSFEVKVQNVHIIDLDDPQDFEVPWTGFTNNKVYVSVGVEQMESATGDLVITNVPGIDLTSSHVENAFDPDFEIDISGYEEDNLPKAVVNKPYPIFNLNCDSSVPENGVETAVYYNYKTPAFSYDVPIVNGSFIPNRKGIYTIVYTVSNLYGTLITKTIDVECVESVADLDLNVDFSNMKQNAYVGEPVYINGEIEATGGSGNIKKEIKVLLGEKEIEIKDNAFVPLTGGQYKVKYTVTDYILNTKSVTFNVNVTVSNQPIFTKEPMLCDYYVSGSKYDIAPYYAYNFSTSKDVLSTVTVKVDGSACQISNGYFTPTTTNANGVIEFTFKAGTTEKKVTRPLINVKNAAGKIDYFQYFATTNNVSLSTNTDSSMVISATDDGSVAYIVPLLVESLSFEFNNVVEKENFKAINISLTDKFNKEQSVSFKLLRGDATASKFIVNNTTYYLTNNTFANQSNVFSFSYKNGYVNFCAQVKTKITNYDNGKEFEGFDSGFAYLTFSFEGVEDEGVSLILTRLWNYKINVGNLAEKNYTRKLESVGFLSDVGGKRDYLSTVTIPTTAYAFGILDPNPQLTLTVLDPNEDVVRSKGGILLDNVLVTREYEIELTMLGEYIITLSATSSFGGSTLLVDYYLYSNTVFEPVITIGSKTTSVKVGESFKIASATAVDADGKSLQVYTYVFDAEGGFNKVTGDSFVAKYSGTYRVCYLTYDDKGNVGFAEYEVVTK